MIRRNLARAPALAAALLLLPSGCGGGDDGAAPPTTLAATTAPTTPATAATTTEASTTATTASPTTAPADGARLIEATYAGGQVAGGAQRRSAQVGEKVRLRIESDVADEVHVHTYDLRAAVGPGQPAVLEFVASIPGRHEVELEKKRKPLLVLEVK